jgi:ABC-type lipopolysaccharide export system ATPase subunit
MALKLGKRAYIMELVTIALQGACEELIDNEVVKKSYLGG